MTGGARDPPAACPDLRAGTVLDSAVHLVHPQRVGLADERTRSVRSAQILAYCLGVLWELVPGDGHPLVPVC